MTFLHLQCALLALVVGRVVVVRMCSLTHVSLTTAQVEETCLMSTRMKLEKGQGHRGCWDFETVQMHACGHTKLQSRPAVGLTTGRSDGCLDHRTVPHRRLFEMQQRRSDALTLCVQS
jgi:hypothetical protein